MSAQHRFMMGRPLTELLLGFLAFLGFRARFFGLGRRVFVGAGDVETDSLSATCFKYRGGVWVLGFGDAFARFASMRAVSSARSQSNWV